MGILSLAWGDLDVGVVLASGLIRCLSHGTNFAISATIYISKNLCMQSVLPWSTCGPMSLLGRGRGPIHGARGIKCRGEDVIGEDGLADWAVDRLRVGLVYVCMYVASRAILCKLYGYMVQQVSSIVEDRRNLLLELWL